MLRERLVRRKIARFFRPAAEVSTPTAGPPEVSTSSAPEVPADAYADDAIEIPEGWRELSWPARRSLASMLTDTPVVSGEDTEQAILAELARRGR